MPNAVISAARRKASILTKFFAPPVHADKRSKGIPYAVEQIHAQQTGRGNHRKGRHAVAPHTLHEHEIEQQHDEARRHLIDKFRRAVPCRPQHFLPAAEPTRADIAGTSRKKMPDQRETGRQISQHGSQSRSPDAHTGISHQQRIQQNIAPGGNARARAGKQRSSIHPDKIGQSITQRKYRTTQQDDLKIFPAQSAQFPPVSRAQKDQHIFKAGVHDSAGQRDERKQRHENLDAQGGSLFVAAFSHIPPGQNRASGHQREAESGNQTPDRRGQIDRRQSLRSGKTSHKNTVHDRSRTRRNHAQRPGNAIAEKGFPHRPGNHVLPGFRCISAPALRICTLAGQNHTLAPSGNTPAAPNSPPQDIAPDPTHNDLSSLRNAGK